MFDYKIQKCDEQLINKARKFFDIKYSKKMKDESIAGRYMVITMLNNINDYNISFLETLNNGAPKPVKNLYWSISHKVISKNIYIGTAISSKPIGIDIEFIKPRSSELLEIFNNNEYKILGEKNWINFYKIWTIKEALVKKLNLTLIDVPYMKLINVSHVKYKDVHYKFYTNTFKNLLYTII